MLGCVCVCTHIVKRGEEKDREAGGPSYIARTFALNGSFAWRWTGCGYVSVVPIEHLGFDDTLMTLLAPSTLPVPLTLLITGAHHAVYMSDPDFDR